MEDTSQTKLKPDHKSMAMSMSTSSSTMMPEPTMTRALNLKKEFRCIICDIGTEDVTEPPKLIVACGHSICHECSHEPELTSCPICRTPFSKWMLVDNKYFCNDNDEHTIYFEQKRFHDKFREIFEKRYQKQKKLKHEYVESTVNDLIEKITQYLKTDRSIRIISRFIVKETSKFYGQFAHLVASKLHKYFKKYGLTLYAEKINLPTSLELDYSYTIILVESRRGAPPPL